MPSVLSWIRKLGRRLIATMFLPFLLLADICLLALESSLHLPRPLSLYVAGSFSLIFAYLALKHYLFIAASYAGPDIPGPAAAAAAASLDTYSNSSSYRFTVLIDISPSPASAMFGLFQAVCAAIAAGGMFLTCVAIQIITLSPSVWAVAFFIACFSIGIM